ncbi:MAG: glycosyltransferase [Prevotellaceae bacterium]|jgi:glycosyltransferase involved in cell wall biosynthesis|nr:glycosyltransferase [Prevotellaceae bacterium]
MKISIITVSLNNACTIGDTINSVLSQTYENIEYIIVDGKSTDGTVEIIMNYELRIKSEFPNIAFRWISEEDNGLYDAMNKGIAMAIGDVVGILNADDFFTDNLVLERIVAAFSENPDTQATIGNVRFVKNKDLQKTVRYYKSAKFSTWQFRFGFMPPHPSFFTYRQNFQKFGLYKTDYKIAADYELLIRFLYKNKLNFRYLDLDTTKMRLGGTSSASLKNTVLLNREIIRACRENDIHTNFFLLIFKYLIKIWELIFTK